VGSWNASLKVSARKRALPVLRQGICLHRSRSSGGLDERSIRYKGLRLISDRTLDSGRIRLILFEMMPRLRGLGGWGIEVGSEVNFAMRVPSGALHLGVQPIDCPVVPFGCRLFDLVANATCIELGVQLSFRLRRQIAGYGRRVDA
jgi:hypothetical protein